MRAMVEIGFRKIKFRPTETAIGCRFEACYKGKKVVWESEDKTLYEDVMSTNARRNKAAKQVIYENVKKQYYASERIG